MVGSREVIRETPMADVLNKLLREPWRVGYGLLFILLQNKEDDSAFAETEDMRGTRTYCTFTLMVFVNVFRKHWRVKCCDFAVETVEQSNGAVSILGLPLPGREVGSIAIANDGVTANRPFNPSRDTVLDESRPYIEESDLDLEASGVTRPLLPLVTGGHI
ncbi:hypothetical protein P691DRAFT_790489 [Macrolepiota fuliginosa MF-IS2]|uniref:Uncharacterized protein n=1 Tax=Macrolepiota fuliginosa MF-IS2 TaxID=1400762 RepID=A0A9P6BXP0_9AGAR|nr:hypothetical protein P691DRAFT_790489 [Macrolepiota fuliginosa MF-IS2]